MCIFWRGSRSSKCRFSLFEPKNKSHKIFSGFLNDLNFLSNLFLLFIKNTPKEMSIESTDPADVIDAQDARLEIYVRMNDDPEKDYCFSVGINDTFGSLLKIFDSLKLSLRPNVFYKQRPSGFRVSIDPGLLTDSAGLLFSENAENFVKEVKLDDKISDFAWPGQLILPVWQPDFRAKYTTIGLLLAWLYTDLPDFISPTPGICLTNQASKGLAFVLTSFNQHLLAADVLRDTVPNSTSITAQIIFFVIHLFKIAAIYIVLWIGLVNPYSLNPYKSYKLIKSDKFDDAKRDLLLSVGWTGSRKATLEEYRDHLREYQVKKYGGLVKASKAGLFKLLETPVIVLGKGEGFDSDIQNKSTINDLVAHPEKYLLNYEIFGEIGDYFETYLSTKSTEINKDIKDFRKYGPIETSERLSNVIAKRKELYLAEKSGTKSNTEKKNE